MNLPRHISHHPIRRYMNSQLELFNQHFEMTRTGMDQEAIHQMRVAIKRIKSIFELKKHIHFPPTISEESFGAMKAIFKASGQLRDIQIQLSLLTHYIEELHHQFPAFFDALNTEKEHFTAQLAQTIRETHIDPASLLVQNRKQRETRDADPETEIMDFIARKTRKIRKLIVMLHKPEIVHELRKHAKQLLFILQFLQEHFPGNICKEYDLAGLISAGERLGIWHDRDVMRHRLEHFLEIAGEGYPEQNPEYQILLTVLESDMRKGIKGIDEKLYVEMVRLRHLLGERKNE